MTAINLLNNPSMKKITPLIFLLLATPLCALQLPNTFSDHMVLQQELPVRVWGKALPGADVQVVFAGQTVKSVVAPDGSWSLHLEPLEASFDPEQLVVVSGDQKKVFEDVLVGEVWLGSGQSNMGWDIKKSVDKDILLLGANDPFLRLHRVAYQPSEEMEFSSNEQWVEDSPSTALYFSAVAYQFARDMRKTLNVPVGIIVSAVGGTPSIAWTRSQAYDQWPEMREKEKVWETQLARYEEDFAAWEQAYADWMSENSVTRPNYNQDVRQGAPRKPEGADSPKRPASLANGMIAPIAGFTLRGVIWYQGEADARWNPENYGKRLAVMVEDWREWWGDDDLPFGVVQLPEFMRVQNAPAMGKWAELRESQRRMAAEDPHTGIVVTLGLGEADDIHPPNKFPVARRLARWALADVYEKIDLRGGPEIVSAARNGTSIILTFDQTGEGLRATDGFELAGFTASDSNEEPANEWRTNFYSVDAKIHGKNQVKLSVPAGQNPVRIRYAWGNNLPEANLTNAERLPASPFEIGL